MKQLACFLTAGAMLLTLCACSGSPASSPSPDPTPTVEPTPTPPLYTNPLTGEATETDLSGQSRHRGDEQPQGGHAPAGQLHRRHHL